MRWHMLPWVASLHHFRSSPASAPDIGDVFSSNLFKVEILLYPSGLITSCYVEKRYQS